MVSRTSLIRLRVTPSALPSGDSYITSFSPHDLLKKFMILETDFSFLKKHKEYYEFEFTQIPYAWARDIFNCQEP